MFCALDMPDIPWTVHRALVLDHKVLHRDISLNNILMDPKHHPRTTDSETKPSGPKPRVPRFIADVLAGRQSSEYA